MSTALDRVGVNARRLRDEHGISLAQLARRTGIAKSTLSQLESGTANPTLATLQAVANALSVDVSRLFDDKAVDGLVHIRQGDGVDVSGETSRTELMRSAIVGPSVVEFHRNELAAGTHETSPSHGVGSIEHVLVVSGQVRLGPTDAQVLASAGDYVSYPGDQVHRFETVSDVPAVCWIVATFPRQLGG